MDSILRAAGMYVALMLLFRVAGRRSLADLTTFDFVLLLIIGEATQHALLGEDFSFTNAMLVIATLIVLDVGLSLAKLNSKPLARFLMGTLPWLSRMGAFCITACVGHDSRRTISLSQRGTAKASRTLSRSSSLSSNAMERFRSFLPSKARGSTS